MHTVTKSSLMNAFAEIREYFILLRRLLLLTCATIAPEQSAGLHLHHSGSSGVS